jgi:hypothetical protein
VRCNASCGSVLVACVKLLTSLSAIAVGLTDIADQKLLVLQDCSFIFKVVRLGVGDDHGEGRR